MVTVKNLLKIFAMSAFAVSMTLSSCTKKPNTEELTKLEEAREAAENAEKKLAELRQERMSLESELQRKEDELRLHEQERDELRMKMGK